MHGLMFFCRTYRTICSTRALRRRARNLAILSAFGRLVGYCTGYVNGLLHWRIRVLRQVGATDSTRNKP